MIWRKIIEMRHWRDDLTLDFDSPVYISFDMDALDPAFAPGVSPRAGRTFNPASSWV